MFWDRVRVGTFLVSLPFFRRIRFRLLFRYHPCHKPRRSFVPCIFFRVVGSLDTTFFFSISPFFWLRFGTPLRRRRIRPFLPSDGSIHVPHAASLPIPRSSPCLAPCRVAIHARAIPSAADPRRRLRPRPSPGSKTRPHPHSREKKLSWRRRGRTCVLGLGSDRKRCVDDVEAMHVRRRRTDEWMERRSETWERWRGAHGTVHARERGSMRAIREGTFHETELRTSIYSIRTRAFRSIDVCVGMGNASVPRGSVHRARHVPCASHPRTCPWCRAGRGSVPYYAKDGAGGRFRPRTCLVFHSFPRVASRACPSEVCAS